MNRIVQQLTLIRAATAILLTLLLGSGVKAAGVSQSQEPLNPADLAIGRPAPEIVGETVDGEEIRLSDFRGKVVVLDFWGDW